MPPSKPQAFQYDLNGNLTDDGYRAYTWDEENRLVAIETTPAAIATSLEPRRSEYIYDAQWRRIHRLDLSGWNGIAYAEINVTRYIWDQWNLLAEVLGPASGVLSTNYYTWGLNLSGSLQGAGGIGGLLAATFGGTTAYYAYDANGNVGELIDPATGDILAHYEYDPFGCTTGSSDSLAQTNPFRFSTKHWDDSNGLGYWGYRRYSPEVGRWLSRDPIWENQKNIFNVG